MIIADTNLIAYFLIPGSFTTTAHAVFHRDPAWGAPLLWRSELRNVLGKYVRSGEISLSVALNVMQQAESQLIQQEFQVQSPPVLALAASAHCSPYDCEFVHVAQTLGCPLVTADKRVLAAFPGTAVSLEDFIR